MKRFLPQITLPDRPVKPRTEGLTMVNDRGWPIGFVETVLESYGHAIDIIKLSATHLHQPEHVVKRKLEAYKRHGVTTQTGGPILEIARLQGCEDAVLDYLKDFGFEAIEASAESLPGRAADEDELRFMRTCADHGFDIHAEVGKKFFAGDTIRTSEHELDIDETVRQFKLYLDNGASYVYFEGHVVRAIVGDMAERTEGRRALEEVVHQVGLSNIIFEVPATYLSYAGKRALQGLLVYLFGPTVSIGNVLIQELSEIEQIRDGMFPTFGAPNGDHPWLASMHRNNGKATAQWWREP